MCLRNLAERLAYPLGLQIVSDEEIGGFDGTNYQIGQGVRSELAVFGERSERGQICSETKGYATHQLVLAAGQHTAHMFGRATTP